MSAACSSPYIIQERAGKAKHYFLATDDDCDISFYYQHKGLTCKDGNWIKADGPGL